MSLPPAAYEVSIHRSRCLLSKRTFGRTAYSRTFPANSARLMTDLEAILRDPTVRAAVPGLSLALLEAGEIAATYAGGCRGPHDIAEVDAETVFEAASLTKPMVSYVALQLAEEGRLDLDTPLQAICGSVCG